jgi:GAF domain-containing protein
MDPSHTGLPPRTASPLPTEDSGAPAEGAGPGSRAADPSAKLADLERERDHLLAALDMLQEVSGSLHFVEILQIIARKLGDYLRLDRCAIFLTGPDAEVRLVASYEDPAIRNLVVDVTRYPELQRAFASGQAVFIPDVKADPALAPAMGALEQRRVRSIVAVPMQWQGTTIGALFVRTSRDVPPLTEADVRFCGVAASVVAKALRNAHRFETLMRQQQDATAAQRREDLRRIALLAFVRRLLDRHAERENPAWAEGLLPGSTDDELDRLVGVALQVLAEDRKE